MPSQSEANKVLRVINGQQARMKFTCTVNLPNGQKVEFQSDGVPEVKYNENTRSMWLLCSLMEWEKGSILLVEQNPGHEDPK